MTSYQVYNSTVGYEPFIDYLKGIAIIGVIWLHCMPLQDKMLAPLWCGMSVSLFLLVQVFHVCRHGSYSVRFSNPKKLWWRIVAPMLFFTIALGLIHFFGGGRYAGGIRQTIMDGGYGPGCYYPWIYIQFAILLPLVGRLSKLVPRRIGWGIFVFSVIIEVICAYIEMPEWLWRILFFRYTFLMWLGYDVVKHGIRLSPLSLLLSGLSVVFILYAYYGDINISPWLIKNGWKVEHWPAYFYPAYLLLWLIRTSYNYIQVSLKSLLCIVGKSSYEIFLCQMFFFALVAPERVYVCDVHILNTLTFILLAWFFSIGGGVLLNRFVVRRK